MAKINAACYDMDYNFSRRKKKRMGYGSEYDLVLYFTIHHAEDIDNPSNYPSVINRKYSVIFWVEPGKESNTRVVGGLNPVWKESFEMVLDSSEYCRFLNLEVVRICSTTDPGTSDGMILVGRVRIPIPSKLSTRKAGRYGLVRLTDMGQRANGHIIVSMELHQIHRIG